MINICYQWQMTYVFWLHISQQRMFQRQISTTNIDKIVDSTIRYELLSFMDAYSGYNQICIYPPNEEKTTFMTEGANFCHPFRLKNTSVPYQHLIEKVFVNLIRKITNIYINDMVLKSKVATDHLTHLQVFFDKVCYHVMRFNAKKNDFSI